MPRFFFDIRNDNCPFPDDVGHELPTRDQARAEALLTLCEVGNSELRGRDNGELVAEVRDERGKVFFTAMLSLTSSWVD